MLRIRNATYLCVYDVVSGVFGYSKERRISVVRIGTVLSFLVNAIDNPNENRSKWYAYAIKYTTPSSALNTTAAEVTSVYLGRTQVDLRSRIYHSRSL